MAEEAAAATAAADAAAAAQAAECQRRSGVRAEDQTRSVHEWHKRARNEDRAGNQATIIGCIQQLRWVKPQQVASELSIVLEVLPVLLAHGFHGGSKARLVQAAAVSVAAQPALLTDMQVRAAAGNESP